MADASFDEPVPTTVSGVTDAVAISASEYVTCVRTADARAQCWGLGPLGDGTSNDSTSPVYVQGNLEPMRQVAVGGMHACALAETGSVSCWGYGGYGELGLGLGITSALVATIVPGIAPAEVDSPTVAISSGEYHTCGLLEDGSAQCWGSDTASQPNSFVPVPVPGLTQAIAIASGQNHDCALLATGKVVCWGDNGSGQLGDGTTTASATPVEVLGLP
jgi:alpha-tubulin suppressor-like RCC1 family protein